MGKGDTKGGRPRVEFDMNVLEGMATIMCTAEECASVLGVSLKTIERRLVEETGEPFGVFQKKHADTGKRSLRRAQFDLAIGRPAKDGKPEVPGHPTMLIWLGKQWLGQEDKITHAVDVPDGTRPMFEVIVPIMGKGKGNGRDLTTEDRPDPDQTPGTD